MKEKSMTIIRDGGSIITAIFSCEWELGFLVTLLIVYNNLCFYIPNSMIKK